MMDHDREKMKASIRRVLSMYPVVSVAMLGVHVRPTASANWKDALDEMIDSGEVLRAAFRWKNEYRVAVGYALADSQTARAHLDHMRAITAPSSDYTPTQTRELQPA